MLVTPGSKKIAEENFLELALMATHDICKGEKRCMVLIVVFITVRFFPSVTS